MSEPYDRILSGLNAEQISAVTSPARVLCIRAGAGSGKTRVLTRRIAYGAETEALDPSRVLALTFTRKAAGELNDRLRRLGLRRSAAAGTFHSVALAQLRQTWEERGEKPPTLLERKVGFVARMLPRTSERTLALDMVGEIEWAKARRISPDRYPAAATAAGRNPPLEPTIVARILEQYEETLSQRRLIDFDDILILCGRTLQRDASALAAFRWKFRHVFVDEFQDVNPLQFALLKVFVGDDPELCVVGDSRQAIYAWNGADSSYLDNFEDHFSGAQTIALRQNYRSTPEILRCASAVLPDHPALVANEPSGSAPDISAHPDADAEAAAIGRALRHDHSRHRRWSDMAVLVRTNAQVVLLAEACAKAGVPVNARTDARLLDRPEIQDALDELNRSGPELSRGLDDLSSRLGPGDAEDDPEGNAVAANDHRSIVESFIRLGRDHLAVDPNATVSSFVAALKTGANEAAAFGADAVDLTTFHAAKGLEWDIVHVAGMERGLSPIGHAKTPDAVAEEHRLVYVALTRARKAVHLHWASERRFGDRLSKRSPSPLLESIAAAARGDDPRSVRRASARKAGAARKQLSAANGGNTSAERAPDDDPVLVALKEWRRSVASANGVPAFVVFHDTTLHAIALSRPDSETGLSAVPGIGPVKLARYGEDLLRVVTTNTAST